jgi:selenocysteine lyase/cysteine desulfurase
MTAVVNKFQRILGIRVPEKYKQQLVIKEEERPIIFVTHMEHHSNHTSWLETLGDGLVLPPETTGEVSVQILEQKLKQYCNRKLKIGTFTACSNVTGIQTNYHQLAKKMHEYGGVCFVDFAASAPYVQIDDMHPKDPLEKLDAIFFSTHKFLGGPGSSGVLIFDSRLYSNKVPDHPGGGTVSWTNPWGKHQYISDIELREDGGIQRYCKEIRTALCIELKEQMRVEKILKPEKELVDSLLSGLEKISNLRVLEGQRKDRLGIVSFTVENIHYNLIVKLLNDRFGIQVRGGCSCAGTYGHYLFRIDLKTSNLITDKINQGDYSTKPGWVRFSIHPTMTNQEVCDFIHAMKQIVEHIEEWKTDYVYDPQNNDYYFVNHRREDMSQWFRL